MTAFRTDSDLKNIPIKQVFDWSRDGAGANLEGKLVREKGVRLGDHPGREIHLEAADGKLLFCAWVYLVEQRLYQVVILGTKEAATSHEAGKFLDSLKLAEK